MKPALIIGGALIAAVIITAIACTIATIRWFTRPPEAAS